MHGNLKCACYWSCSWARHVRPCRARRRNFEVPDTFNVHPGGLEEIPFLPMSTFCGPPANPPAQSCCCNRVPIGELSLLYLFNLVAPRILKAVFLYLRKFLLSLLDQYHGSRFEQPPLKWESYSCAVSSIIVWRSPSKVQSHPLRIVPGQSSYYTKTK